MGSEGSSVVPPHSVPVDEHIYTPRSRGIVSRLYTHLCGEFTAGRSGRAEPRYNPVPLCAAAAYDSTDTGTRSGLFKHAGTDT